MTKQHNNKDIPKQKRENPDSNFRPIIGSQHLLRVSEEKIASQLDSNKIHTPIS